MRPQTGVFQLNNSFFFNVLENKEISLNNCALRASLAYRGSNMLERAKLGE